jgi:hypothetical protein
MTHFIISEDKKTITFCWSAQKGSANEKRFEQDITVNAEGLLEEGQVIHMTKQPPVYTRPVVVEGDTPEDVTPIESV